MFPGLLCFFAVWFGFSIVNGSRRVVKNGEGLGTHVRWTRGGCREGRVGGEGEGGSAQLQMCASWLWEWVSYHLSGVFFIAWVSDSWWSIRWWTLVVTWMWTLHWPRVHLTSFTWWVFPGLPLFSALPLPCVILNANRRAKHGGGLGTRLWYSCFEPKSHHH